MKVLPSQLDENEKDVLVARTYLRHTEVFMLKCTCIHLSRELSNFNNWIQVHSCTNKNDEVQEL